MTPKCADASYLAMQLKTQEDDYSLAESEGFYKYCAWGADAPPPGKPTSPPTPRPGVAPSAAER